MERAEFEHQLLGEISALRRRARMLEADRAAAEDLLSDTLERSLLHWSRFRSGGNLRRWLLAVMRNLFIDRRRRLRSMPVGGRLDVAPDTLSTEPPADLPPRAWERVELSDLPALLQRLPDPLRTTAQLVLLEGRSYRGVADQLAIPVATVGTRVARARARLRALVLGRGRLLRQA